MQYTAIIYTTNKNTTGWTWHPAVTQSCGTLTSTESWRQMTGGRGPSGASCSPPWVVPACCLNGDWRPVSSRCTVLEQTSALSYLLHMRHTPSRVRVIFALGTMCRLSVVCNACTATKRYLVRGSAMVALDKAMTSLYRPSICLYLQRFGRNFKCKVAACSHLQRVPNYRIVF